MFNVEGLRPTSFCPCGPTLELSGLATVLICCLQKLEDNGGG